MSNDEWHVASLVVYCQPQHMQAVTTAIESLQGAEVPVAGEQGKLVVALEGPTQQHVVSCIDAIAVLDGIITTTLIYHEFAAQDAGEEPA